MKPLHSPIRPFLCLAALALTGILHHSAHAQSCTYPPRIFQTLYTDLLLDNGTSFGQYGVPDELNRTIWLPHCQDVPQTAEFRIEALGFKKPWFSSHYDTQYYFELVRTPYNCTTGALGVSEIVHTSTVASSTAEFISISFSAEVTDLAQYRVKYYAHGRNLFGNWPKAWGEEWTNTVTFGEGQASVVSLAILNAVGTKDVTTIPYGTVSIDTVCAGSTILVNGSGCSCENGYAVTVHELDTLNWQTGDLLGETGWIPGEAPHNVGITGLVPWYQWTHGKDYLVTFVAGPGWNPVYLPFTFADVKLDASLSGFHHKYWKSVDAAQVVASVSDTHSGTAGVMYPVHRFCSDKQWWIDARKSTCAENWGLRVIEIDPADFSETGVEWTHHYHHSNFLNVNLTNSFGSLVAGKFYKLTLFANAPYTIRNFYIEAVPCVDGNPRGQEGSVERVGSPVSVPLPSSQTPVIKPIEPSATAPATDPTSAERRETQVLTINPKISHTANGIHLHWASNSPNHRYHVERSTDLRHWRRINELPIDAQLKRTTSFTDTEFAQSKSSASYYRIIAE